MLRCAAFVLSFLIVGAPARADWYVTPFAGFTFGTGTNFIDIDEAANTIKFAFGGAVTLLGPGIVGVEGDFSLVPGFFQRDNPNQQLADDPCCLVKNSRVTTLMGNFVIAAPLSLTGYGLRPYASAGPGLMRARLDDSVDVIGFERNLFAINVGGGVIGLVSDKRGVRFDLRYFRNVRTRGEGGLNTARPSLGFWRAGVGLILKF